MSTQRSFDPRLYLVLDLPMIVSKNLKQFLEQAIAGGVTCVQLREKNLSTKEWVRLGKHIQSILKPFDVTFFINDRVDVALACGADGVHIGQSDLDYADARRIAGPQMLIGVSVENLAQVYDLKTRDVDYLAASPVFETPTKPDACQPWGLEGLKTIRSYTSKKLVAIGGINQTNAAAVLQAGADGLAVVSAICKNDDPYTAAAELKSYFTKRSRGQ